MKLQFADYDGPTGLYVATGRETIPLNSPAGAIAFVGAGMQSGTIDPEQSERIQKAVDAAMQTASRTANSTG